MSLQPADDRRPGRGDGLAASPAIVEFDDEGNATLHLPAAGRRRFLVDESAAGTFQLVPLLDDDELPAELRARMAANEADPNRLVRHPRHRA